MHPERQAATPARAGSPARIRPSGGTAGLMSGGGEWRGAITATVLTLVTSISYAAVVGTAWGDHLPAQAMLSSLIGACCGGLVAGLLSPGGVQIYAPRASVAAVMAAAATAAASDPALAGEHAGLLLTSWMTGCVLLAVLLQLGFGLLRLGSLIRVVPHAVVAGFSIGIALQLARSQLPYLWPAGSSLGTASYAPLIIGLTSLAVAAWAWRAGRFSLGMPGGLVAGMLVHQGLMAAEPGFVVSMLPAVEALERPMLWLPAMFDATQVFQFKGLVSMVGFALAIALVNSVETLLSNSIMEDKSRRRLDPDRALMASAVGSLVAVCFGGWPVASGAATSVASWESGARSRRCAVAAAVGVSLLAIAGYRLIGSIPMAALAGMVLCMAFGLAAQPMAELLRADREGRRSLAKGSGELGIALLVCATLLAAGVSAALLAGVVAAAALAFAHIRSDVVKHQFEGSDPRATAVLAAPLDIELGRRIRVIEIGQPLCFATVEPVATLIDGLPKTVRMVIVDLSLVGHVDTTARKTLSRCAAELDRQQRHLVIVRNRRSFARAAEGETVFDDLTQALQHGARTVDRRKTREDSHGVPQPSQTRPPTPMTAQPSATDHRTIEFHLAVAVGPIAALLMRRTIDVARDHEQLCRMLAEHIGKKADRVAFLEATLGVLTDPRLYRMRTATAEGSSLGVGHRLAGKSL
jgi:sulfate permease, SulP family